jgi:hypothetical protein
LVGECQLEAWSKTVQDERVKVERSCAFVLCLCKIDIGIDWPKRGIVHYYTSNIVSTMLTHRT